MNDRGVVRAVVGGLTAISLLGLGGLLWLAVVGDEQSEDSSYVVMALVGLVGITCFALGGLVGLLVNTWSVDEETISDRARSDALAEVEALGPNEWGQGD